MVFALGFLMHINRHWKLDWIWIFYKSDNLPYWCMAYFSLNYGCMAKYFKIIHCASNTSSISLFKLLLYMSLLLNMCLVAKCQVVAYAISITLVDGDKYQVSQLMVWYTIKDYNWSL